MVKQGQVYLDRSNPPYKNLWVVTEVDERDMVCLLALDGSGTVADVDTHSFRVQRWSGDMLRMTDWSAGFDNATLYFKEQK